MKLKIDKHSAGYTLIELLIVITIIGILAAIAIPNYRGYRDNAKKVTVISTLRQIRFAQEVYWTDNLHYFPLSPPDAPIVDATSKIAFSGLDMDIPVAFNQKWSIVAVGGVTDNVKSYLVHVETDMDVNQNGINDSYTFSRHVDNAGNKVFQTEITPLSPDAGT